VGDQFIGFKSSRMLLMLLLLLLPVQRL